MEYFFYGIVCGAFGLAVGAWSKINKLEKTLKDSGVLDKGYNSN